MLPKSPANPLHDALLDQTASRSSFPPASQQLESAATLSATIDDTRFSIGEPSQDIVAAEYYVDIPPWVNRR